MAVIKSDGKVAGAGWEAFKDKGLGNAYWVCGRGVTLSSAGFASCVGMVILGDAPQCGLVAHFWNPTSVHEAGQIVDEYNKWLVENTGGFAGDDMQALVFGGNMVKTDTGLVLTQPRVRHIAGYLNKTWGMAVTTDMEGASEVTVDLTAGKDIKSCVHLTRERNKTKHSHHGSYG